MTGLYVDRAHLARENVADLLVEAAYLVKQPGTRAKAWALIAVGIALHKMAELDVDESVKEEALRLIEERRHELKAEST